jgi:hypothetical protein
MLPPYQPATQPRWASGEAKPSLGTLARILPWVSGKLGFSGWSGSARRREDPDRPAHGLAHLVGLGRAPRLQLAGESANEAFGGVTISPMALGPDVGRYGLLLVRFAFAALARVLGAACPGPLTARGTFKDRAGTEGPPR